MADPINLAPWINKDADKNKQREQDLIRAGEDRAKLQAVLDSAPIDPMTGQRKRDPEVVRQIMALDNSIKENRNAMQGLDANGEPYRPEYTSLIDPTTGLLKSQYQLDVGKLEAGTIDPSKMQGYQAFRGEALRTGPSSWAKMQQQQQEIKRMEEMEKASRQSNSGAAQARSGLAMRGGMSSGARERIARDAANNLMGARQGIGRTANLANIQLLSEDEKNRLSMLNQLPGMETNIEQFNIGQKTNQDKFNIEAGTRVKEYNIGKALQDKQMQEQMDMDKYKAQLGKFGAEKQAQATASSGGGGGGGGSWLCTKIHEAQPLSNKTKSALFKLRKYSLRENPKLANCYLYECSDLAERMNVAGVDFIDLRWFTDTITELVESKNLDEALEYYVSATLKFVEKFWPDTKNETLQSLLLNKKNEFEGGL